MRWRRSLFVVAFGSLMIALTSVVASDAQQDTQRMTIDPDRTAHIGRVEASTERTPLLRIGNEVVTKAEFRREVESQAAMLYFMRGQVALGDEHPNPNTRADMEPWIALTE